MRSVIMSNKSCLIRHDFSDPTAVFMREKRLVYTDLQASERVFPCQLFIFHEPNPGKELLLAPVQSHHLDLDKTRLVLPKEIRLDDTEGLEVVFHHAREIFDHQVRYVLFKIYKMGLDVTQRIESFDSWLSRCPKDIIQAAQEKVLIIMKTQSVRLRIRNMLAEQGFLTGEDFDCRRLDSHHGVVINCKEEVSRFLKVLSETVPDLKDCIHFLPEIVKSDIDKPKSLTLENVVET